MRFINSNRPCLKRLLHDMRGTEFSAEVDRVCIIRCQMLVRVAPYFAPYEMYSLAKAPGDLGDGPTSNSEPSPTSKSPNIHIPLA